MTRLADVRERDAQLIVSVGVADKYGMQAYHDRRYLLQQLDAAVALLRELRPPYMHTVEFVGPRIDAYLASSGDKGEV